MPGGISIKNFGSAGGGVYYNGGLPYDSNGALLVSPNLIGTNNTTAGGTLNYAFLGDSRFAVQCLSVVNCNSITWGNGVATFGFSSSPNLRVGQKIRFVATGGDASTVLTGVYSITQVVTTTSYNVAISSSIASGTASAFGTITCLDWLGDNGWAFWANALSGQRLRLVYNGGRGGDSAAQAASRISEITSRTDVQYCFIDVGINDYNTAAAGGAVAATVTSTTAGVMVYIDQICQALIAANVVPVLMTMYPVAANFTNASNIVAYVTQHNNLLRNYAENNARVMLIDQAGAVTDPTTGYWLGGNQPSAWTYDGIHPARMTGRSIGQLVSDSFGGAKKFPSILTNSLFDNARNNASNYNVIQNAPWVNTGANPPTGGSGGTGGSGLAITGWYANRTAGTGTWVASAVARTVSADGDALGYNQRIVYTSGGATDNLDVRINLNNDANYYTLMSAGTYELRGTLQCTGVSGSGLKYVWIQSYLQFTDAISTTAYTCLDNLFSKSASETANMDTTAAGNVASTDFQLTLCSQPWVLATAPTGQFGIGIRMQFNFGASGTAVTINLGRWSLVRVA